MGKTRRLSVILTILVVFTVAIIGYIIFLLINHNKEEDTDTKNQKTELSKVGEYKEVPQDSWAFKEDQAIELVKMFRVVTHPDAEENKEETVEQLIRRGFLQEQEKMKFLVPDDWLANHLKPNQPYYEVRFKFKDNLVEVGPVWVVDLETKHVIAINEWAKKIQHVKRVKNNLYLGRLDEVTQAIVNHKFESGIKLGTLLQLHFFKKMEKNPNNKLIGWTIVHEREEIYHAYFQWQEKGNKTYAEWLFDLKNRKLTPMGILARDFMAEGVDFNAKDMPNILPKNYNPETKDIKKRWINDDKKYCKDNKNECRAKVKILEQQDLMEAVGWFLTTKASNEQFLICKKTKGCIWTEDKQRDTFNEQFMKCKQNNKCAWNAEKQEGVFIVFYSFQLDPKAPPENIEWSVDLNTGKINPLKSVTALKNKLLAKGLGTDTNNIDEKTMPDIMPNGYDPSIADLNARWVGEAKKKCAKSSNTCMALGKILAETDLVKSIQLLLTTKADHIQFQQCKDDRKCGWRAKKQKKVYNIIYSYKLDNRTNDPPKKIGWQVNLDQDSIDPLGAVSEMAFWAVHYRL